MFRAPNIISISSDEEEEDVENVAPEPPKVDEVSLIAIKRKRSECDDLEDDLVVVEVPDKDPPEDVTTHNDTQIRKKVEKTVCPLIDLLSDEEEEIIFRPVTLIPKRKRIKPTPVLNETPTTSTNKDVVIDEMAAEAPHVLQPVEPVLKVYLPTKPVSILNNQLTKDTNKTKKDSNIKDDVIAKEIERSPVVLSGKSDCLLKETDLNDTILMDNNKDDHINENSSTTSNENSSNSTIKPADKEPETNLQRFESFLRLCNRKIVEERAKKIFRLKHAKFIKSYKMAGDFVNTAAFQSTLCQATATVKTVQSADIIQEVLTLYNVLKENRIKSVRSLDDEEKLDHLYELLKQFTDRIKVLECVEVDYDDDDNSAYCQLQTYRAKAVKVHERICDREKKSKYLDRMTYSKLDFDRSSYQAINIAINRKYKNNSVFPTFDELNRLIRKTVTSTQIVISEIFLKEEIKTCFILLGELLQRRRKHELVDSLLDYVDPKSVDPALKDAELDRKLRENKRLADQRTEEIVEKFCKLQESGCEPDFSSDPDDSNVEINSSSDDNNN